MYHPLVPKRTGFTSCNGAFSEAYGLRYTKLCLKADMFTALKEPEHEEQYISLPAKTDEIRYIEPPLVVSTCKYFSLRY